MLATLTRKPIQATGALISVIGHTTREDLEAHTTAADARNGFLNRFLIIETLRTRELPLPQPVPEKLGSLLGDRVKSALCAARRLGEVVLTEAAGAQFAGVYSKLAPTDPSLAAAVLSRGPAHVRRLALLYALLRGADKVDSEDMASALAFWSECERSVRSLFGTMTGDRFADRIMRAMAKGTQYGRTELRREIFGTKDVSKAQIDTAIEALLEVAPDEFREEKGEKTRGRPKLILHRR
jgi:hypothetical protein